MLHPTAEDLADRSDAAPSPDGTRIATLDSPSRTVLMIDASDGGAAQAVHPGPGVQFVQGWQPRGTGAADDYG